MTVLSQSFDDPAAEAARFLNRLGLAVLMIGAPCAGLFARRALFVLLPIGVALVLISMVLMSPRYGLARIRAALASHIGLTALFIFFWAALSLIWTPFQADATARLVKGIGTAALVMLVAAYLPERTKTSNLNLLPIGVALTAAATLVGALLGVARFVGGPDFDGSLMQRSVVTAVILVWPALGALALRDRWLGAGALAIIVAGAAIAAWMQIALAAMAAGALVFAAAMTQPQKAARVTAAVVVPLVLAAPLLPLILTPLLGVWGVDPAFIAPLQVWSGLVVTEWPRLITGHGLDMATRGILVGFLPLNTPKSILFEIWYDLGLLGAIGFALLAAQALLAAGRAPPAAAPALLAGFVAGLAIAIMGLETAQLWWLTLIGLNGIAYALVIRGMYRTRRPDARTADAMPTP